MVKKNHVVSCSNLSSRVTQLVDYYTLCKLLNITEELEDCCAFPLCTEHYGTLYRQLNPLNRNCKTCNKVLHDVTKAKKCPNPVLIKKFLSDNLDYVGTITDDDLVCTTCYKSHLVLIKHA